MQVAGTTVFQGREVDWHTGVALWTQDFPRADRHFAMAVRRLTHISHPSCLRTAYLNLDDGDNVPDWPWLYAVQVGGWDVRR